MTRKRRPFLSRSAAATALLVPVLASCGSTVDQRQRGDLAMRRANYELAYAYYQAAQQENPSDPETARAAKDARIAYLRDLARRKIFEGGKGDYESAMEDLERVLALSPKDAAATEWLAKAKLKAADRETTEGQNSFATGDLEEALRAYYRALQFVTGHPPAEAGLQAVADELARRRRKADDHYLQGVRALGESLFGQTYYYMFNSELNDPARRDAIQKKQLANERLAERRFAFAQQSQALRKWLAALSDYQSVKKMVPGFPNIDQKIAEMEREVKASDLTKLAEHAISRGDLKKAIDLLQEGYDASQFDRVRMSELLVAAKEKEREVVFNHAKDLTYDHQLTEALDLFKSIEEKWPGYSNVRTRISILAETIELVKQAYDRGIAAQAAGKREDAMKAFKEVLASYPGFKDAQERLDQARE